VVYRIGAPFRVRLDRVNEPQRRVDFSPAEASDSNSGRKRDRR
jgi:hypothetical protein